MRKTDGECTHARTAKSVDRNDNERGYDRHDSGMWIGHVGVQLLSAYSSKDGKFKSCPEAISRFDRALHPSPEKN